NLLCGSSEASFAQCAGYIATELGTEGLTYAKTKALLKPIDDIQNGSSLKLPSCSASTSQDLILFNPDAIGDLSDDASSLELDSQAGRCNKYNLQQEGIKTQLQNQLQEINVKLILRNSKGYKNKLIEQMDETQKELFSQSVKKSKLDFPKSAKFNYGTYQFDHIVPVHQLINNLIKKQVPQPEAIKLVTQAVAMIEESVNKGSTQVDVNSPNYVRFVKDVQNRNYMIEVNKSFDELYNGRETVTPEFLIEVLSDANNKVFGDNPTDVFSSPNSVYMTSPLFK
ncbi:MAG: hypothetical protein ACRCXZ_07600, partial [Patescibacteria group bacterium]